MQGVIAPHESALVRPYPLTQFEGSGTLQSTFGLTPR